MRRTVPTVLLALAVGLAVTACGGKSNGHGVASANGGRGHGGASPSPTASVDPEEAQRQFAQCMREHGVNIGDPDTGNPSGGPVRVQASAGSNMDAAVQACQKYLPAGQLRTPDAQELEQARQFAQCMREHGVDVPDPDPNGGGLRVEKGKGGAGSTGVNPDDPAFKAAEKACQDKLPGKGMTTKGTEGGGGR